MYELLLQFDRCGLREELTARLELMGRIERGENGSALKGAFDRLLEEYRTLVTIGDFSQVDTVKPTIVTNLLEVKLP